ncbi:MULTISPECIES: hypothetical protein [Pseudomonas]|uniref:hypothetical protein n=1 Tax=Pseudomonas TaxID=286 RepID=UPI00027036A2|nr:MULTISPECIES: hypothetical protein [Pseudomonas]EJM26843.1 hypothetical protein PMI24_03409 [Pseudomonas sp. GM25]MCU0092154.1 hypothetical protein [Pseudomonas koreensis]
MRRPLAILAVFFAEVALLFHFQKEVVSFASSINEIELFKGLGTLLFPAPIAFLLWYWRDTDKQRTLQNDAVRLQNENDKLVLEKKILEGEAAVARETIDKANLEIQLANSQAELAKAQHTERALRELDDEDVTIVLRYLNNYFEEGNLKSDVEDPLPLSIKNIFLTQAGQLALREWAEKNSIFEPDLLNVFTDAEFPDFRIPIWSQRK